MNLTWGTFVRNSIQGAGMAPPLVEPETKPKKSKRNKRYRLAATLPASLFHIIIHHTSLMPVFTLGIEEEFQIN